MMPVNESGFWAGMLGPHRCEVVTCGECGREHLRMRVQLVEDHADDPERRDPRALEAHLDFLLTFEPAVTPERLAPTDPGEEDVCPGCGRLRSADRRERLIGDMNVLQPATRPRRVRSSSP